MKLRKLAVALGVTALTFTGGGVALATNPATAAPPTDRAHERALRGLLDACSGQGFTALATPIPVTAELPDDNPATPNVDESDATFYTFVNREQCKRSVRDGYPVALIRKLPAGTVTVPAPGNFPTPPPAQTAPPPVVNVTVPDNGAGDRQGLAIAQGTLFPANADVSVIVLYRDGSPRVFDARTDAQGAVTFNLAANCGTSNVPTQVTILAKPVGPAAVGQVPNTLCA